MVLGAFAWMMYVNSCCWFWIGSTGTAHRTAPASRRLMFAASAAAGAAPVNDAYTSTREVPGLTKSARVASTAAAPGAVTLETALAFGCGITPATLSCAVCRLWFYGQFPAA